MHTWNQKHCGDLIKISRTRRRVSKDSSITRASKAITQFRKVRRSYEKSPATLGKEVKLKIWHGKAERRHGAVTSFQLTLRISNNMRRRHRARAARQTFPNTSEVRRSGWRSLRRRGRASGVTNGSRVHRKAWLPTPFSHFPANHELLTQHLARIAALH